jgi:YegS/Rv2252/BmrU family lipid kinase
VSSGAAIAIVNPASSNGRTLRRWPALQRELERRIDGLQVVHSEAPGHATLLARTALESGTRLVVSIGGDGTNNEVLCGFVDARGRNRFPEAELGLVQGGTGGDFLRHLGRRSLPDQLAALAEGSAHSVDYGIAHFVDREGHPATRPFLNVASAGISGLVDYYVGRSNKLLGPAATYVAGSLQAIANHRGKVVRIAIDDAPAFELPIDLAVVANGQYFGGGMWITPHARCNDGRLDLIWTGGLSRLGMMMLLARLFRGTHLGSPSVHAGHARAITITPCDEGDVVLVDIDGEQPGRLPASFHVEPSALRLRAAGLPGPARIADSPH